MHVHRSIFTSFTVLALIACGPKAEPSSPADEDTGQETTAQEAVDLEFMGVHYSVTAAPVALDEGMGVHVAVTAEIADEEDHAFVQDTMYADEGPVALRFHYVLGDEEEDEPRYTGSMEMVTQSPGTPLELSRTYPAPDQPAVMDGQTLELVVGIWGTEAAEGGQRYSPDLVRITLTAGDDPQLSLEPADPSADLPKDFVSWEIGSHKLVIKPFYPLKQKPITGGGEGVSIYQVGDTVVRIKSSQLVVNNQMFGNLPGGAGVLVDSGKVSVDGKDRTGEPMDKKKLLEFYPNQKSEHELAGHKITISPGAVKFGTISVGDEFKIVLDDRQVVIKNEVLSIDGVCYGELKPKAKITIFFDEITVGKKKLSPVDCTAQD